MVKSLARYQSDFLAQIRLPSPGSEVRGAPESMPPSVGWAIYRRNWKIFHDRALRGTYETLASLLSEFEFRSVALRYRREYASRSGSLDDYGEDLPVMLVALARHGERDAVPAWAADVARLDWAIHRAFLSADAPRDSAARDERLADPALTGLAGRPATALVESSYPIYDLWLRASTAGRLCPVVASEQPQSVLVTRPATTVLVHLLTPAEGRFALALLAGHSLEEADQRATELEAAFDVIGCLQNLASVGAFLGLRPAGMAP